MSQRKLKMKSDMSQPQHRKNKDFSERFLSFYFSRPCQAIYFSDESSYNPAQDRQGEKVCVSGSHLFSLRNPYITGIT